MLPNIPRGQPMPMELHWEIVRSGALTILDVLDLLPWVRHKERWKPWRAFLCAVYGLPMDAEEFDIFRRCTGRDEAPTGRRREVYMGCGRRAKKSAVESLIGFYEGAYNKALLPEDGSDISPHLAPGEFARVPIIAKDLDDAQSIYRYLTAILDEPAFAHLRLGKPTIKEFKLRTMCEFVIEAARLGAGRSKAVLCSLNDEVAFWPKKQAANPDTEILRGIRGGMANMPDAMLYLASSLYAPSGELYEAWKRSPLGPEKRYAAPDSDELFWMADTVTMHDTKETRAYVKREFQKDPVAAASEVGSPEAGIVFRPDIKGFLTEEQVRALVAAGIKVRPPRLTKPVRPGQKPIVGRNYFAFVDASGGSSDSMTLAIAHWNRKLGKAVLDFCHEWPAPFQPKKVVRSQAKVLNRYKITSVKGDAYAGEWPRERFADRRITYIVSARPKVSIYLEILPVFNAGEALLLDDETLIAQLASLERRMTLTGREIIDHPPGGRDDLANAVCGALLEASDIGRFLQAPPPETKLETTTEIQDKEVADMIAEMTDQGDGRNNWNSGWEQ